MRSKDMVERVTEGIFRTGELILKQPLLELYGEHRVLIENHNGIRQYTLDRIDVKTRFGGISVSGSGLEICRMSIEQVIITGNIDAVTLFKESCG